MCRGVKASNLIRFLAFLSRHSPSPKVLVPTETWKPPSSRTQTASGTAEGDLLVSSLTNLLAWREYIFCVTWLFQLKIRNCPSARARLGFDSEQRDGRALRVGMPRSGV